MPSDAAPNDAPLGSGRCNLLLLSFLSFVLICLAVWVVSAGKKYREEYAQATETWRVGTTRAVEITLVKEDKDNLACAADRPVAGLRCGFRRSGHAATGGSPADPQILRPYNTVGRELLLGAGLWNSPALQGPLPNGRFAVICNYHIEGVIKSVSLRFAPTARFAPVGKSVTLGTLNDCMVPR